MWCADPESARWRRGQGGRLPAVWSALMLRNKLMFTAAGFVAGVAMTLTTIGATVQPVGADQAENAYMMAQKAQVAHSTYQLDNAGLHALDVDSNAGTITAGALGKVRQA